MLRITFILTVAFAVAPIQGGSFADLFGNFGSSVQMINDLSGNIFDTVINSLSNPSSEISLANPFRGIIDQALISDLNLASVSDDKISQYNRGLNNDDRFLSCDQLITKYGHPVEKHETTTEDGYILTMFRIPGNGSAVLLLHSLLGSSDDYVVAGPDSGIGYLLAKDGYDVWLGNVRGNKHSRRHVSIEPSEGAFWNFSWHEIGYYDVPAMIDYVLNTTGQEKLKYIGHSQGNTAFWVMGSERPEYNDKISHMVALSPVAFTAHLKSPIIRVLASTGTLLMKLTNAMGVYEMLPENTLMKTYRQLACGTGPLAEIFCAPSLLICGFNVNQLNITNLPVIFSHIPAGASAKQLLHYSQGIISKKFRQFDHGATENLERYGSIEPPEYALGNVRAPVTLVYSESDWLAEPRDVYQLYSKLPNVTPYRVKCSDFHHLDFVFANDVKDLVYKPLRFFLSQNTGLGFNGASSSVDEREYLNSFNVNATEQ